jgi:anti-anti-sigma regulatory factor
MSDDLKIVLKENLGIATVTTLYQELRDALSRKNAVILDANAVTRVDAASLQTLGAFCSEARTQGVAVHWEGTSVAFVYAARLLGLMRMLGLESQSERA